jgi:hypothetical protein
VNFVISAEDHKPLDNMSLNSIIYGHSSTEDQDMTVIEAVYIWIMCGALICMTIGVIMMEEEGQHENECFCGKHDKQEERPTIYE